MRLFHLTASIQAVLAIFRAPQSFDQTQAPSEASIRHFTQTEIMKLKYSPKVKSMNILKKSENMFTNFVEPIATKTVNWALCTSCKMVSEFLEFEFNNWLAELELTVLGDALCMFGLLFSPDFSSSICTQIVRQQFKEAIYPIFVDEILSKGNLCTFVVPVCELDKYHRVNVEDWVEDVLMSKPKESQSNDYVNNLYSKYNKETAKRPIKIALISDLHVDFDYMQGMSNNCGKPLCCRSDSGKPKSKEETSGKWGDYQCDMNELTLKNMLSFIKEAIKPDAVFWGGDSIPHNVESLRFEDNVNIMKNVT